MMASKRRSWTMKEVQRIAELKRQARTIDEIARMLGRNRSDVTRYWRRYGHPRRRANRQALWPRVLGLHRQGHSASSIARQVGACLNAVVRWLSDAGLVPNRNSGEPGRAVLRACYRQQMARLPEGWALGDVAASVLRSQAARAGWPEADSVCQARVLQLLYEAAHTEREAGLALGYSASRHTGQYQGLRYHLDILRARGLVIVTGSRPGRTRSSLLYGLPGWLQERYQARQGRTCRSACATGNPRQGRRPRCC